MRITWSVPVFSRRLGSGRGDLVRARALIRALRSRGHDVRVVEGRDRPGRQVEESLYRKVIGPILPVRARLALRDAAWWWRSRGHGRRVAEAAREQGADVLVETQVHGVISGAVAARSTGLPLVLDDVSPLTEIHDLGAGLPGLGRWAFRSQRAAAGLLVVSSVRIRRLVNATPGPSAPVSVLPNGVDRQAHEKAIRNVESRAPGVGDDVVIGFVGSFQPWHDVPLLIRAFADLKSTPPARLRLLLIGDGPGRKPTLDRARELGVEDRVVATGVVPPERVPELLAACDIGVLAGTNDYGHPMKLLEYAAAGLPLVAPELPPVRELVAADARSAFLFTAGDPVSLTRTLARLAEDPDLRRRAGDRARRHVARSADWPARGRRLARALERVTAGREVRDRATDAVGSS